LFLMPSDRSGRAERVNTPATSASTESYDHTGRAMAYTDSTFGRPAKVMITSLDGSVQPQPLDDTKFAQGSPKFSPSGGFDPVWRRDGRELFYRNGDRMMAVPVAVGDSFDAGRPQESWRGPYSLGISSSCGAPGLTSVSGFYFLRT
jgi:hypothetical protein